MSTKLYTLVAGNNYAGYHTLKAFSSKEKVEKIVADLNAWADLKPTLPKHFTEDEVKEYVKAKDMWLEKKPYPHILHIYYGKYQLGELECECE